jgi:hypothetical protein
MTRLELDEREAEALRHVLEDYVSDLRMEIANTDSQDVRDELKERETHLKRIAARLRPSEG